MERDGAIIEENILPRRAKPGQPVGGLTFAQAKALADDVRAHPNVAGAYIVSWGGEHNYSVTAMVKGRITTALELLDADNWQQFKAKTWPTAVPAEPPPVREDEERHVRIHPAVYAALSNALRAAMSARDLNPLDVPRLIAACRALDKAMDG